MTKHLIILLLLTVSALFIVYERERKCKIKILLLKSAMLISKRFFIKESSSLFQHFGIDKKTKPKRNVDKISFDTFGSWILGKLSKYSLYQMICYKCIWLNRNGYWYKNELCSILSKRREIRASEKWHPEWKLNPGSHIQ